MAPGKSWRKRNRKQLIRAFDINLTDRTVTGTGNDGWVFFLLSQMECAISSYVEPKNDRL